MTEDWYWAAARLNGPAANRFIIEQGQVRLWARVHAEVAADKQCAWMHVHEGRDHAELSDIFEMIFTVVLTYQVNQNRFVLEAAKIPVFAKFLRSAKNDLSNYLENSLWPNSPRLAEPYSDAKMRALGRVVSQTLGHPRILV